MVRQRAIDHDDSDPARVFDVYPERKPVGPSTGGRGGGSTPPVEKSSSFDDERKSGGQSSAEFHNVSGRDTTPLHFAIFIKAFREIIERRNGWQVHFSVEALSSYVPDCQPADRLVLFARIKTPQALGHLVELEPLQGQASYTLAVLRRNEPEQATIREVGTRLQRWLTNKGRSHVTALLEADEEYRVLLSTHRDIGTENWVGRILDKIDPPEKRPAWTRGVAI